MRALLYCRSRASGPDLDEQQRLLVEAALSRGFDYEVVRDDGLESGPDRSDKLAEALDLLDRHHADVLMAVRLDVVLGGSDAPADLVARSERAGWGIIVSGDGIDTTSRFGRRLGGLVTAEERELISRRTRDAMQRQKAEGAVFGRPVDPGFLVTYRDVLAMVGRGMSYNAVARTLNDQGIPTAKGRTWYASTVKAMVESETARRLERPKTG
jgi:DNA invertase Pin-like site-specific DNA recombinase